MMFMAKAFKLTYKLTKTFTLEPTNIMETPGTARIATFDGCRLFTTSKKQEAEKLEYFE